MAKVQKTTELSNKLTIYEYPKKSLNFHLKIKALLFV